MISLETTYLRKQITLTDGWKSRTTIDQGRVYAAVLSFVVVLFLLLFFLFFFLLSFFLVVADSIDIFSARCGYVFNLLLTLCSVVVVRTIG